MLSIDRPPYSYPGVSCDRSDPSRFRSTRISSGRLRPPLRRSFGRYLCRLSRQPKARYHNCKCDEDMVQHTGCKGLNLYRKSIKKLQSRWHIIISNINALAIEVFLVNCVNSIIVFKFFFYNFVCFWNLGAFETPLTSELPPKLE